MSAECLHHLSNLRRQSRVAKCGSHWRNKDRVLRQTASKFDPRHETRQVSNLSQDGWPDNGKTRPAPALQVVCRERVSIDDIPRRQNGIRQATSLNPLRVWLRSYLGKQSCRARFNHQQVLEGLLTESFSFQVRAVSEKT
jgi:hypothetical protein